MRVLNSFLFFIPLVLIISCNSDSNSKIEDRENLGPIKEVSIIPMPLEIEKFNANYKISKSATIFLHGFKEELNTAANYLAARIEKSCKTADISISNDTVFDKGIHLKLNKDFDKSLGDEGYEFNSQNNLIITANTPRGIFYGIQTLFQLLPVEIYADDAQDFSLIIAAVIIKDNPRYSYRGMHLDPCRHFFSVEFTKRYIDYMAYHKLNKFHWHLTEDQGWRIEIKKYPKLTEIGSKRGGTLILNHDVSWKEQKYDTIPVEGFYTQEEIRDIVKYASERFIEVIPEIEMPGHSVAALAGYPQMSCTGGPFELLQRPGVTPDVYCAGNDSVFIFLKDILDEVAELFPSQYIHIGGDECPKDRWKECSKCQKRIKENNLSGEHELQSWFISEIEKHINSKGKTLIGWSEIMEGGIAPNAVLQSWIGVSAGVKAAKEKHNVIMSPYQFLYFDGIYVPGAKSEMEPYGQTYCWTNTERTYSFEPTPDSIPDEYHSYFIGVEATMWSEYIKTEEHAEYLLMPRISALSEIGWTAKELKNYENFATRLDNQYLRYDQMDVNYRIPHPKMPDTLYINGLDSIEIESPTLRAEVRFTLDGTEPTELSNLYESQIHVKDVGILKAKTFMPNGRASSTASLVIRNDQ